MRRALALAAVGPDAHVPQPLGRRRGGDAARRVASKGRPPRPGGRTPRWSPSRPPATTPGRHALHHPRALRPPRPHPAVHRGHRRRRGGAGGGRCARPRPPGVGAGGRRAPRGRGRGRRGRGGRRGRRPPRAVPEAPAHGTALGRAQAGRHHGRAHRRTRRHGALAHRRRGTRRRPPPAGAVRRRAGRSGDRPRRRPRAHRARRSGPRAPALACRARPAPRRSPGPPRARAVGGARRRCSTSSGPRACCRCSSRAGRRVAHAFHRAGLVDRYVLYLAPALFGGDDAVPMFSGPGAPASAGPLAGPAGLGHRARPRRARRARARTSDATLAS